MHIPRSSLFARRSRRWIGALVLLWAVSAGAQWEDYTIGLPFDMTRVYIVDYSGAGGDVTIPATFDSKPVVQIGAGAFANKPNLTRVTVPAGVTNLGNYAFASNAGLTAVIFLGNAPTIGADVFAGSPVTVYYPASASGWGSTFGGRPTAVLGSPGPSPPPVVPTGTPEICDGADNDLDGLIDEVCETAPAGPILSVTPARRLTGPRAGRTTFAVTNSGAGTLVYWASESHGWLQVSGVAAGTNRGTIAVSYRANPGAAMRSGTVRIRAPGAIDGFQQVRILQGGRVRPLLAASPEVRRVGAAKSRIVFAVANKGGGRLVYKASESGNWLDITRGGRGTNRGVIAVTCLANSSYSVRTGTVTVAAARANNSPVRLRIVQAGRDSSRPAD